MLSEHKSKVNDETQTTNSNLEALSQRLEILEKKATANGWDNPDEELGALAGKFDPKL